MNAPITSQQRADVLLAEDQAIRAGMPASLRQLQHERRRLPATEAPKPYPSHLEWLRAKYGPNWCIFARTTARTRAKGQTVITPARYEEEREAWADGHPAVAWLRALPESPFKLWAFRAAMRDLDSAPLSSNAQG